MIRTVLRLPLLVIISVFVTDAAFAQQGTFVYLQSESNLPYDLQWGDTKLTASSTGYLVIPQVAKGEHRFQVNFGITGTLPNQFTITVGDSPRGFSIRQGIDNVFSLVDMIDNSVIKGSVVQPENKIKEPEQLIISQPAKTAEPAPQPTVKKEEKEPQPQPVPVKKQPETVRQQPEIPKAKAISSVSAINKIFDRAGNDGIDQVYVIVRGNRSDTIAVFVPVLKDHEPLPIAAGKPASAADGLKPFLAAANPQKSRYAALLYRTRL